MTELRPYQQAMIDQNSAYPEIVIHDDSSFEIDLKRWKTAMDARVRPMHIVMSGDMSPAHLAERMPDTWRDGVGYRVPYTQLMGRGLRALPGYAQGLKGDRQYQVSPHGKKFLTRVYVRGMWTGTLFSKRRKTAIAKGEKWLGETK